MSISLTCGPSGAVITGDTEEELVSNVQAHARAHENTELSRERILAQIRGRHPQRPIDAAAWAAMTAPSAAQKLCDTSDMVIVHRMFRRECALLPQLVAAVAGGDLARARTVAGHAREVLDMLHHHHVGEDELLWPRLSARTRFHNDLLARMDSQHQGLAVLLEHLRASAHRVAGRAHRAHQHGTHHAAGTALDGAQRALRRGRSGGPADRGTRHHRRRIPGGGPTGTGVDTPDTAPGRAGLSPRRCHPAGTNRPPGRHPRTRPTGLPPHRSTPTPPRDHPSARSAPPPNRPRSRINGPVRTGPSYRLRDR